MCIELVENWNEAGLNQTQNLVFVSAGLRSGTELGCGRDCVQAGAPWLWAAWLHLSLSFPCRLGKYFHLFSPGTLWQCDVARECSPPSVREAGRMSFISIARCFWCWAGSLSSGISELWSICLCKFRVRLAWEGFFGCPVAVTYG